jgi:hypothetical protein
MCFKKRARAVGFVMMSSGWSSVLMGQMTTRLFLTKDLKWYVLGARSHLVRSCYLQGSTVVFKRLAVDFGHVAVSDDVLAVIHLPYLHYTG